MDALTQLGIAGATLGILLLVVKYFIQAVNKKDDIIIGQHRELTRLVERGIESQQRNTEVVKQNTEAIKKNSDDISHLIMKLVKE